MPIDFDSLPSDVSDVLGQFPDFAPAEFIDSGANGYVLTGMHAKLKRQVALKIYYHGQNEIDQEPTLIAAISHENVLRVHDARSLSDSCSFFMTPCANYGDLATHLREYSISTVFAHQLLTQLLSGLTALHESRLVHRDIKPENLLVHDETLLIADFGSVRRVSDDTGVAPASRHSILYRPPEAIGDSPYFDFSSDTYQAGLVGCQLIGARLDNNLEWYLTGPQLEKLARLKADGDQFEISKYVDSCVERRIKNGTLVDWKKVPFFVPKSLVRCLKRAVSGARYASCSEFLFELQRTGANMPNWIVQGENVLLMDWRGRDYQLGVQGGDVIVRKRSTGKKRFIQDNQLSGGGLPAVYSKLRRQLGVG